MAVEQYTNDAVTALNGGINNSVTSIDVDSATGFPASAQYRIRIDNEIMLVTAGAGTTTWTVTRGIEGTAAASHLDDAPVEHVLTAGAIDQMRIDNCGADTVANRPAAAKAGRLYIPTSGSTIQRDTGSLWTPYGPINKLTQTKVVSDFTWVNQGSATAADQGGTIYMYSPSTVSANTDWHMLVKNAPSPPYKITMLVSFMALTASFNDNVAIVFRQSSDGKFVAGGLRFANAGQIIDRVVSKMNSPTSLSTDLATAARVHHYGAPLWLRFEDNNTNRIFSLSVDGINFMAVASESRTTFLTADQVGFGFSSNSSSGTSEIHMTVHSYEES